MQSVFEFFKRSWKQPLPRKTCLWIETPIVFRKEEDGTYVTQVGEKAGVDISFLVTVGGERAYETLLFIEYNTDELDVPVLGKKVGAVNIKSFTDSVAVISLGNPMEPGSQVSCLHK